MGRIVVPPAFVPPSGFATFPHFFKMGEGQDGGTSARALTGAVPALLRYGVQSFKALHFHTPARATALHFRSRHIPRFTRNYSTLNSGHRRGVHRLAACLAPDRQVSEQLRGYLSPGWSSAAFMQHCNGLDYTNQGRTVKLEVRIFMSSIDFCSFSHCASSIGCLLYSVITSRIFVNDGFPYCLITSRVQGKNHKWKWGELSS